MCFNSDLPFWANISAIGGFIVTSIGATVGIYGFFSYRLKWNTKIKALEIYLKRKKEMAPNDKKGQQTIVHLISHVGLTENEILKISFESKKILRTVSTDKKGLADKLYFEYKD